MTPDQTRTAHSPPSDQMPVWPEPVGSAATVDAGRRQAPRPPRPLKPGPSAATAGTAPRCEPDLAPRACRRHPDFCCTATVHENMEHLR
jgi:hypothetical protein